MTYEIPVDGYEGRVQLQTLGRRIARACVHFLQVCACLFRVAGPLLTRLFLFLFHFHLTGEHDPHLVGQGVLVSPRGDLRRRLAAGALDELSGGRRALFKR